MLLEQNNILKKVHQFAKLYRLFQINVVQGSGKDFQNLILYVQLSIPPLKIPAAFSFLNSKLVLVIEIIWICQDINLTTTKNAFLHLLYWSRAIVVFKGQRAYSTWGSCQIIKYVLKVVDQSLTFQCCVLSGYNKQLSYNCFVYNLK